jgi:hypothetical protein
VDYVAFHPTKKNILASYSRDNSIKLWNLDGRASGLPELSDAGRTSAGASARGGAAAGVGGAAVAAGAARAQGGAGRPCQIRLRLGDGSQVDFALF